MQRKNKVVLVTDHTNLHISKYDLEGSCEAIVNQIQKVFAQAAEQYKGVEGVALYADWRPREWSDGEDLYIYATRPETDEERATRKATEKQRRQAEEARELALLQQLQSKYAGKV
jgi:hypothetical protein